MLKKLLVIACLSAVLPAVALSLAEARGQIGEAIAKPEKMTAIMKGLSAADQKAFVADVNAAIAKMPGSKEEKTAAYVAANRAAVLGASKGNTLVVLAEVFATVPPEGLAVINEVFAEELFNRSADQGAGYSDAQFAETAEKSMKKISERTQGGQDAETRNTLAAMMFIRSYGKGTEDEVFVDRMLAAAIPDEAKRAQAKQESVPAALAGDYGPILSETDAGAVANLGVVIRISGAIEHQLLVGELQAGNIDNRGSAIGEVLDGRAGDDLGIDRIPRTMDPLRPWNPNKKRGDPDTYIDQTLF